MKKSRFFIALTLLVLSLGLLSACTSQFRRTDPRLTNGGNTTTAQGNQNDNVTTNGGSNVDPTKDVSFDLVADPTGDGYYPSKNQVMISGNATDVKKCTIPEYQNKPTTYEKVLVEMEGYAVSINKTDPLGLFYLIDNDGNSLYVYGCSKLGTEFVYTGLETGGYQTSFTTKTGNNFTKGAKNFIENEKALIEEGQYVRLIGLYGTFNGVLELHSELVGTSQVNISQLGSVFKPKTSGENVTISLDKNTYNLNDKCTATINVNEGFTMNTVSLTRIDGTYEELEVTDGKVSFNVGYADNLIVTTSDNSLSSGTKVATFSFGSNGDASHKDGSAVKNETYTDTNGGYTLTLSNCTKVYEKALDAKGNSCIKLGSSDTNGSFNLTVANDVDYVIIYISGYKGNNGSVTINGNDYAISAHSNDGTYSEIMIDTRTEKTINLSSNNRLMINTIEFYKAS